MGRKREERKCPHNYCGCQKEANQMALGTVGLCSTQLVEEGENGLWQRGERWEGGRKWGLQRRGCKDAKETILKGLKTRGLSCTGQKGGIWHTVKWNIQLDVSILVNMERKDGEMLARQMDRKWAWLELGDEEMFLLLIGTFIPILQVAVYNILYAERCTSMCIYSWFMLMFKNKNDWNLAARHAYKLQIISLLWVFNC